MSARPPSHFYPADLVRVLTFGCVIAVHTASTTNPLDSVAAGAVVMLLHFTREAFFILTGFVLSMRYQEAAPAPVPFWRRRLLLVGVPYVCWSVIYSAGLIAAPLPPLWAVAMLGHNLLTGTAWFHLYFLLVSMQFYLLFPLFRRLLRLAGRRPWVLLTASAALQVGIYLYLHRSPPTGLLSAVQPYAGSFVLTYQFFFVVGGLAAAHRPAVESALRRHPRAIVAAVIGTAALAEGWYWRSIARGGGAIFATDVFQPVMIPWAVAVIAGFLALGLRWSDRRAGGAGSRFIEHASDRSFGVFLIHPAILWVMTAGGDSALTAPLAPPLSSAVVYLLATVGSLALVEVFRRTPLSLPLTGKRRAAGRTHTPSTIPTSACAPSPASVGSPSGVARGD